MTVQGNTIELRQHVNGTDSAVDTVADRNIHQAVFSGNRNRRFRPVCGERLQTGSGSTTENQANCFHKSFPFRFLKLTQCVELL